MKMYPGQVETLARETRPSDKIWNALSDVYWLLTLSQLTVNDRRHQLGDENGFEFSAKFRVEWHNGKRKIRAVITPKQSGHYYTNLTRWRWFALEPKLRGEEVETLL